MKHWVEAYEMNRVKIVLQKRSKGLIDYNYQFKLASAVYTIISDGNKKLAESIHKHDGYKNYCFSNFIPHRKRTWKNGMDFNVATLLFSSPDKRCVDAFRRGIISSGKMKINSTQLDVIDITAVTPRLDRNTVFETKSPVYVKTKKEIDGKLKEWDLNPYEEKFVENVETNLVNRFREYYQKEPEENKFRINPIETKGKRIIIDNGKAKTFRRCHLMTFTADASPDLLQFAYDSGIGEKNAMGFGCIEVKGGKA